MLALNDMLRQQLALSGAFIESTRRHYKSVLESLGPANHKYTTLEDTKEVRNYTALKSEQVSTPDIFIFGYMLTFFISLSSSSALTGHPN